MDAIERRVLKDAADMCHALRRSLNVAGLLLQTEEKGELHLEVLYPQRRHLRGLSIPQIIILLEGIMQAKEKGVVLETPLGRIIALAGSEEAQEALIQMVGLLLHYHISPEDPQVVADQKDTCPF